MSFYPPSYALPGASWQLEFSELARQVLERHAQRKRGMKESVGQLFTRDLTSTRIVVEVATVLLPSSASWARICFDTKRAMAEREAMFEQGLHCIGLWHTHPESAPRPSSEDRTLAREHSLAAQPELSGLVFAIMGTLPTPAGLRVWIDDGQELRMAQIVDSDVDTELSSLRDSAIGAKTQRDGSSES